jgi:hypothetical protein
VESESEKKDLVLKVSRKWSNILFCDEIRLVSEKSLIEFSEHNDINSWNCKRMLTGNSNILVNGCEKYDHQIMRINSPMRKYLRKIVCDREVYEILSEAEVIINAPFGIEELKLFELNVCEYGDLKRDCLEKNVMFTICGMITVEKLKIRFGRCKKRSMWSDFQDSRVRRKKTWSEAHINTTGMFYGGPRIDILEKNWKREDIGKFKFLLGYRNIKKRKFISDVIIISIYSNFDEEQFYPNFLRQFFQQIFKRMTQNNTESLYKRVIREVKEKEIMFKKFLIQLRMFYYTTFRKRSILEETFKMDIGNFGFEIQELTTKRCKVCKNS